MAAELIYSAPVVAEMAEDQRNRLEIISGILPVEARLSVVSTLPEDPPTLSYLGRMAAHADKIGMRFVPHYYRQDAGHTEDDALARIHELNRTEGSATMIMMPLADRNREAEVRAAINPNRDPDALGWLPDKDNKYPEEYPNYPATPLSVLRLAEHAMGAPLERLIKDGELDPSRVVFYGLGNLVNRPAHEILTRRLKGLGVEDPKFTVISRENGNTDLIKDLGSIADVVLAAAGSTAAAGALKPEYLRRENDNEKPLTVIDAAFCTGADGKPYGNLDPAVYDPNLDFDVKVTPYNERRGPVSGVGPLTAAFLLEHTVQAVERDALHHPVAIHA